MKRIAIVVQRYGREVNGGAELHARLLAQALRPHYDIDVLTSRALDYRHWHPHFPAGEEALDGCRVLRFDHPPRSRGRRRTMPLRHKLRFKLRRWLPLLGLAAVAQPRGDDTSDGLEYLRAQGPTMDGLIAHLERHAADYAALIFMTARFHPAALGVLVAPTRSILVPTLHDEKTMVLPHFHRVFRAPAWIMYNTAAERVVAQQLYGDDLAPGEVCGVGIELPAPAEASDDAAHHARWMQTAARHGIRGRYLIYVGRVDASKGCDELFRHFARLAEQTPEPLQLVVCGKLVMARPDHPHIVLTGFVSDAERDQLIAHAAALVVPSRHESLSLVLLESLAQGCPVIVNRGSEVLRQHVRDSGVGATYDDYAGFAAAVAQLLAQAPAQRAEQAQHGRRYVAERYDWATIVDKYRRVIERIDGGETHPTS
ncbi:glycosyltransferase [Aquincola sp. S2]|uniref:Glycosyltransferase n=1 Tax=Pseudaquabacterium terrae TaxID=2732868 RepID=A0ABX2EH19_9BURK|nr:glycosyltransferase [Aquabacterium terrae]NRF67925.1 glycosyltransferase [Aquabacterium terrae]